LALDCDLALDDLDNQALSLTLRLVLVT
jgi:hypothetical protein